MPTATKIDPKKHALSKTEGAAEEAKRGQKVFELRGAPILPLPEHVLGAVHQASVENLSAPSEGLLALREAIANKLKLENHLQ